MREREIVVRLRLPGWPRRRWPIAIAAAVLCLGVAAYAALPNPPFTAGEALSAKKLNENFQNLDARLGKIEQQMIYSHQVWFKKGTDACVSGGSKKPCEIDLTPAGFHSAPNCTVSAVDYDSTGYAHNILIGNLSATSLKVYTNDMNFQTMMLYYVCVGS